MQLPCRRPVERSYCGTCMRCVEACPAGALKGSAWVAGMPREEIPDATACDNWKKENYYQDHRGHNCGICSAVCPYSLKKIADSS
jgi:epoxyqueuosine reductase